MPKPNPQEKERFVKLSVDRLFCVEKYGSSLDLNVVADAIRDTKDRIHRLQADLAEEMKCLNSFNNHIIAKRSKIDSEETRQKAREIYAIEYDKLIKRKDVRSVQISENQQIKVQTKKIVVKHEGIEYNLGTYSIYLYVYDGYVAMFGSKSVWSNDFDGEFSHPHIPVDGEPCLGNISLIIPQLIGESKFSIVVDLCIQYLKSYNPEGPYCPIEKWPENKRPSQARKKKVKGK